MIRICCKLWWSETRGQLTRTIDQWAKVLRITQPDCERILNYVSAWKIGDVQRNGNGEVTVISRRMLRDEIDRKNNALRQQRFKDKQRSNVLVTPSVTPRSQRSSSSSSSSNNKKNKEYSSIFLSFWERYPKKAGKPNAFKEWNLAIKNSVLPGIDLLLEILRKQIEDKQRLKRENKFCPEWPDPERWIKNQRWLDEIEDQDGKSW